MARKNIDKTLEKNIDKTLEKKKKTPIIVK
jgi:hypothetical protein